MKDRTTCLWAQRVLWSPVPSKLPVTLVTQLSFDRLMQIKAQCSTWKGPLAAAIYLPLLNSAEKLTDANSNRLQNLMTAMDNLMKWTESGKMCQLRAVLLVELFSDAQAMAGMYPVNTLRNYARLMADTPLVANVDVDMLPSASLSDALLRPDVAAKYIKGAASSGVTPGAMYVMPGFETFCGGPTYADVVAVASKAQLKEAVAKKCVDQFRIKVAPACHAPTDFPRWLALGEGAEPYTIQYEDIFEPWFISDRRTTLWYDDRYRGYGKNKIVQVAAMHAVGFQLNVLPDGFLVHRPHQPSKARKMFLRVKFASKKKSELLKNSLFDHIETLWKEDKAAMQQGTYKPHTDAALQRCLQALPWWKQT